MEIFIQAKLEDYMPGRASQKALRTVPPIRSQGRDGGWGGGKMNWETGIDIYTVICIK